MFKFEKTHCSQCGSTFGAGNSGFSHCEDHQLSVINQRGNFGAWMMGLHSKFVVRTGRNNLPEYNYVDAFDAGTSIADALEAICVETCDE